MIEFLLRPWTTPQMLLTGVDGFLGFLEFAVVVILGALVWALIDQRRPTSHR